MAQQTIYVDGIGFVPIESGQTPQEAIAAAESRRTRIGIESPMGSVGLNLPSAPDDPSESRMGEQLAAAFPQLAGIVASFTPQGRGIKAAAGVPAVLDAVIQAVMNGVGNVDPVQSAAQGAMGVAGKWTGDTVRGVGNAGENMVRRSLNLSGDLKNEVAEEVLPKLALRENARMTKEGVQRIRDKAEATGAGGLEDLAEAMGKARLDAATAPSRITLWPNELVANFVRQAPREMAIGRTLAKPLGVGTREVIAPTAETGMRAILALLASQMGAGGEEPAMETSRGPRRRGGS